MPGFVFRLATLLRLRETTRDVRRGELSETLRRDDALRQQIQRLDDERSLLDDRCRREALPGMVSVGRLAESHRYRRTLDARRAEFAHEREAVLAEVEERRLALVEADREVAALEKLRQRQSEEYRQEAARADVKRLDEVGHRRSSEAASAGDFPDFRCENGTVPFGANVGT